jgi:hypothetical protein
MSYWDSSALVKLYVQELDSSEFQTLAREASRVATGPHARQQNGNHTETLAPNPDALINRRTHFLVLPGAKGRWDPERQRKFPIRPFPFSR